MEEVLFSFERQMDRAEIADYLRRVADTLDSTDELTLEAGSESVALSVPPRPTFEVKAEREASAGPDELSIEFELEWDEGEDGTEPGDLQIG